MTLGMGKVAYERVFSVARLLLSLQRHATEELRFRHIVEMNSKLGNTISQPRLRER